MIQIFKYFGLSLLIAMFSLWSTDIASAKVKKTKKTVKVISKASKRKKNRTSKSVSIPSQLPLPVESLPELEKSPPPSATDSVALSEEGISDSQSLPSEEPTPSIDTSDIAPQPTEMNNFSPITPDSSSITESGSSAVDEPLTETMVDPITEKTPEEALAATTTAKSDDIQRDFLTLQDALKGAYAQSPLLTAEYQVKEAHMKLTGAKREWFPKAAASIGYTKNTGQYVNSRGLLGGQRYDTNGNAQTGTTQGALTLQQNLYSGGSTTANILAQEKTVDATVAAYMSTVRDTFVSAIKSFIELSTKQEVFRLNKANQALLERQLEVAQNRYEFGELTRYDVAATQAKLDKAKADVIAALSEAEIAKAAFIKVTGITTDKTLEKPKEPTHLIPASKVVAIQIALQSSPDLHKQEALAEAAKAETDVTFGGLLPSFDINATASRKLTDNWDKNSYFEGHGKTRREELEATATLSIPLDFRGSTQASIRQTKYAAAQKRLTAIYERRNVMELVSKYWDSLEAARARINQIKSQVTAARIAVETVTEEFLAGNKTTLDVLTSEQELFSAQVELVNAEQSLILNAYQLLATIGRLDVETLGLDVTTYDPTTEYNNIPFWGIDIAADERIQAQEISASLMKGAEETK